jgi:hypothetical protein
MGAVSVGGICLHLRGEVKGVFMDWLRSYRPDLVEHYEQLYARGAYAPREERARIGRLVRYRSRGRPWREAVREAETRPPPPPRAVQQPLF